MIIFEAVLEILKIEDFKQQQNVQLEWTLAFKSQKVGYQSNQKLLHHC